MDEVPIALGLQIIDAQALKDGIARERGISWNNGNVDLIDNAFNVIRHGGKNHIEY
jgi:hypothetical protein